MDRLTLNQKLWQTETEDLLKRIKKLQSQGINIEETIIPPKPYYISPKALKSLTNIKKEIEALEKDVQLNNIKVKHKKIKEEVIKTNSGVSILSLTGREYLPSAPVLVMNWVRENISQSYNNRGGRLLGEFVDYLIRSYGFVGASAIIYNANANGINITTEIIYDSSGNKTAKYISQITEFIKDVDEYNQMKDFVRELFDEFEVSNWADELDSED